MEAAFKRTVWRRSRRSTEETGTTTVGRRRLRVRQDVRKQRLALRKTAWRLSGDDLPIEMEG